ncbi:hypothetical protein GCM10007416_00750 [Kroppenstedtia guangzhouensis]|uniref:Uncharacterized protein n=1 Tax=Kroppenstedtia guangzhouensis TaxID=1274356 RepID=A0ABQ1FY22_9BACL|nr:hypothetical protein [Kroppenstedtia guangzhouensis]GGA32034.1 hypothetical protein GCM10007416_00750 [Kroppenstedtia guangzhouensis]
MRNHQEAYNFYVLVRHLRLQPSEYAKLTVLQRAALLVHWNEEQKKQEKAIKRARSGRGRRR